ncbi:MAG: hypothetical protein JWQ01_4816 [Massilia sp.]|nr:hypothetical protein [Massilia sp.]
MPLDTPVAENDIVTFTPAASEVGALALITLDPARYVAEVFKPFRTKLDALKAEAALIHFKDDRMYDSPHRYVNIDTVAGMEIAVKFRAAFRDEVRIAAEKTRVSRKAPLLSIGKLLDSEYKEIETDARPHESYFDDAIRESIDRKEVIKAAKEKVEAERVAAIRAKITDISTLPARNTGSNSATLYAVLAVLADRQIEADEFAELVSEARAAVSVAGPELNAMYAAAKESEQAEADRLAELAAEKRRNAEQAEANRLAAIENEKIANEQAAERQRMAAQQAAQELAAAQLAAKVAANLKADQDALAEQVRRQREVEAERQRQLDEQQAAFEAQKAEFAAAVKMEADHAEALIDNATFDDAMTRLAAVDTPTFYEPSDDLASCTATAQAMPTNGRSLVQADADPVDFSLAAYSDAGLDDPELSDAEIVRFGAECGLYGMAWVERLEAFCGRARAEWMMP